jgi:hypothetical protein
MEHRNSRFRASNSPAAAELNECACAAVARAGKEERGGRGARDEEKRPTAGWMSPP